MKGPVDKTERALGHCLTDASTIGCSSPRGAAARGHERRRAPPSCGTRYERLSRAATEHVEYSATLRRADPRRESTSKPRQLTAHR